MCWGSTSFPIGRLILVDKEGREERFQYEGMDKPKKLLEDIQKQNPHIAIGYTQDNLSKFVYNK